MANRYWVGGSGNWSDNTNHWSASSGGSPGASKPGVSDIAIFDGISGGGTCTADETISVDGMTFNNGTFNANAQSITIGASGLDASGSATKTLSCSSSVWIVKGNLNISGTSLTFTESTSEFRMEHTSSATLTMKSGITFYKLTYNSTAKLTLGSHWYVANTFDAQKASGNADITTGSSYKIYCRGNIACTHAEGYRNLASDGRPTIEVDGTGAQAWTGTFGYAGTAYNDAWNYNIIINKASGTLTMSGNAAGNFCHRGDFTWTQGTVDWSTNTVQYYIGTTTTYTINTGSGMHFYKVYFYASATVTLSAHMYIDNTLSQDNDSQPTINGSYKLMCAGNVNLDSQYRTLGTASIEFTGSSSQTFYSDNGSAGGAYVSGIEIAIIINKSGGTLTFESTDTFHFGCDFTYTAGTVDVNGTTARFIGTKNLAGGSMAFAAVVTYSSGTRTLTGNLSCTTLTISSSTTLAGGSYNITVTGNVTKSGTFTKNTSNFIFNGNSTVTGAMDFYSLTVNATKTLTLTSGTTYTCTGNFSAVQATINSTTPGSDATLTVSGTQGVAVTTATDIDSSAGLAVHNYLGTNNSCVNWDQEAAPVTRGHTWAA